MAGVLKPLGIFHCCEYPTADVSRQRKLSGIGRDGLKLSNQFRRLYWFHHQCWVAAAAEFYTIATFLIAMAINVGERPN